MIVIVIPPSTKIFPPHDPTPSSSLMTKKLFGQYVTLSEPDALPKEVLREAKKLLVESIKKTADTHKSRPFGIKFKIDKNVLLRDPDTGEEFKVCHYSWRAYFDTHA